MKPARCLGFDSRRRVLKGYRARRDSPRCIKIRVAYISGAAPPRRDAERRQRVRTIMARRLFSFLCFATGDSAFSVRSNFHGPVPRTPASSCLTFFESPVRSLALAPTPPSCTFFRSPYHVSRVFSECPALFMIVVTPKLLRNISNFFTNFARFLAIIFYRSGYYLTSYEAQK